MKGPGPFARNQKPILSQSLSFPARGVRADNMKKSIEAHPMKGIVKHARDDGTKHKVPITNGSVTSVSHLNQPNRRISNRVNSKESNINNGKTFSRQTSSATKPGSQQAAVMFCV